MPNGGFKMKDRKTLFALGGVLLATPLAITVISKINAVESAKADGDSAYHIRFNATKNNNVATTYVSDLNNEFNFESDGVSNYASGFITFQNGGYFKNTSIISGITSITLTTTAGSSFKIDYGYSPIIYTYVQTFGSDTSYYFAFQNAGPNYFKITSTTTSTWSIITMDVEFACVDTHENWNVNNGATPFYNEAEHTMTFGMYPQSLVPTSNTTTYAALNSLNSSSINSQGYYVYNDEMYAPVTAVNCAVNTPKKFRNGTGVTVGQKYWFKVEPIKWTVLGTPSNNDYFLFCQNILDSHSYHTTSNASNYYATSTMSNWLNSDFLNAAFAQNNSFVKTVSIDNSVASTLESSNSFASSTPQETKVFLMSRLELKSYSFNSDVTVSDSKRQRAITDYAIAKGVAYKDTYYGAYFTRSPRPNSGRAYIYLVNADGASFSYNGMNDTFIGVCPAMHISL